MPNPTIPLASGGEREIETGDTVKTAHGITGVAQVVDRGSHLGKYVAILGLGAYRWLMDGTTYRDTLLKPYDITPGDIVLILGQAEQDNGDGTVMRLLPVCGDSQTMAEVNHVFVEPTHRKDATGRKTLAIAYLKDKPPVPRRS
jgi:hypothetical protein